MNIIIFLGPTLCPTQARQILNATYLPPASRGDLYRAARSKPAAIGIIDGYFQSIGAVWHKEILWSMSQGIHVFGSASMGALRAAELADFGMIGVGKVYQSYRNGVLDDDDEVAVIHSPQELGYKQKSEAMVNIRYTLTAAASEAIISNQTCAELIAIGKSLFYPYRSYHRILQIAIQKSFPHYEIKTLQDWLKHSAIDQKREDACAMLGKIANSETVFSIPKKVDFQFADTAAWNTMVREYGNQTSDTSDLQETSSVRKLLHKLKKNQIL